jgi:enamine deaminase RidA (YjgF/YER057c/UK114 family)
MTANPTDAEIDVRLQALGLTLPPAPAATANYVPFVLDGHHLYVSGQVSRAADGTLLTGQLGGGLAVADGQAAARACVLNILSQAKAALGSLARIERIVRLTGFVNAAAGFVDHPAVVNGASDLMVAVLGDAGRHTRAAVGCSGLPANAAVEVDAIILVK